VIIFGIKCLFTKESKVGDVLKNETEKLRKEIEDLMKDVWED
jgi:hypothetical protein